MAKSVDVGIYALMHRSAGLIYVGSSRSVEARFRVWRVRFECLEVGVWPESVSKRFYEACRGLSAADWQMVVIERFDVSVGRAAVAEAEYRYVDCLRRLWLPSLLNVVMSAEREAEREVERIAGVPYVKGYRSRPYDRRR